MADAVKKRLGRPPISPTPVYIPTKVRPDAKYVSKGNQEYVIFQDGLFWKIRKYRGGKLAPELNQAFTSHRICEQTLIQFLRRRDIFDKAIYPGCPRLQTKSTETS